MAPENDEPVIKSGPTSKKKFQLPRWSKPVMLVALLCMSAVMLQRCLRSESPDRADVRGISKPYPDQTSRVSVENSPEYARKIDEYTYGKTESARTQGNTFVPPIASSKPVPHPKPEAPVQLPKKEEVKPKADPPKQPEKEKPKQTVARPKPRPLDTNRINLLMNYMKQTALAVPKNQQQNVQILNAPPLDVIASTASDTEAQARSAAAAQAAARAPGLKAGDILYAINRVTLDSDAPGPSMVEIVDGPYKGAKAIGAFKRLNEHLVLTFDRLVTTTGRTYKIQGYAIDPRTDRTAVRSDVDNHTLQRWGGIIAASFLDGFGQAVASSGASSYSNAWGGGTSIPNYDTNEQLWIAAGKVGQRMANVFENRFGMAPTVTLKSGTDIGVLIVTLEGDDGAAVGTAIQAEQKNASDHEQRILNATGNNNSNGYQQRRFPVQGIVY